MPMTSFFWIHSEDNKPWNLSMQFVPAFWYPPSPFRSPYTNRSPISNHSTDVLPLTSDAVFHTSTKQRQEKVQGITFHERTEREYSYSSTLSLTLALDGVGCQHHAPAFYPRERPMVKRLVGPRSRSGRHGKPRPHRVSIPGPARSEWH